MTPNEASKKIGCSPQQVRWLIRRGLLEARRVQTPIGHYYDVTLEEVERYRDTPQSQGFPRGQKREGERGPKSEKN